MSADKKEREHLLALNQVIARQVMEKSRMVAGKDIILFLVMSLREVLLRFLKCMVHGYFFRLACFLFIVSFRFSFDCFFRTNAD